MKKLLIKNIGLLQGCSLHGDKPLRGIATAKYMQFVQNCFKICPRQALHAKTLGFVHPTTRQQMDFSCEIPADMTALIKKWEDYCKNGTT